MLMSKVIVSCAITGGIHTPTMSESLPIAPEDIASQSVAAANAGAAIIHLHARNPTTGEPAGDPDIYRRFLPTIKQQSDAVLNLTTGGSPTMAVQDRLAAARAFRPELCSLNMGTMNFGLFPMADKYQSWKHAWEEPYLRNSDDFVFRNSFRDIDYVLKTMADSGSKFEHECYDIGHLYNLAHFVDKGLVKPPFFIQMIFGILGGIGASPDNLHFMKQKADELFGRDSYQWSVLGAGRHQMTMATQGALMGSHVRVGLEDSLFIGRGELATSNAQQVEKIVRLLSEFGLEVATPAEAREMLGLKGGDRVDF